MKKLFNFRPIVFFALAFVFGIVFGTLFFAGRISVWCFIVIAGMLAFLTISLFICRILSLRVFELKKIMSRCLVVIIAMLLGIINVSMFNVRMQPHTIEAGTYNIVARVAASPMKSGDTKNYYLILDNAILEKGGENFDIDSKIKIYAMQENMDDTLELGDYVSFKCFVYNEKISNETAIRNGYSNLNDGIFIRGTAYSRAEKLDRSEVNIFEAIKLSAKKVMLENMGRSYAGIGYGMIFGDKSLMDADISETYRNAGISHLLAVSGLHIGFVVTILVFILSRLKVDDKVTFVLITFFLLLYLILCEFSVSAMRAFIMTVCMLYAKCRQKLYDSLSALAFALVIILLISPLSIFDISLQMSFCAVLGILLLAKPLTRIFEKVMYKPFANALGLSLAASIGISIVTISAFEKVSVLGVFTNMVVIPIASIAFMFLFLALIVALIFPAIGGVLCVFDYIMMFVNGMASAVSVIRVNNITAHARLGYEAGIFSAVVLTSDYCFAKRRVRVPLALLCAGLSLCIMFV